MTTCRKALVTKRKEKYRNRFDFSRCFSFRTFSNTNDSSQLISICRDLAKKTVDELIADRILCKRVTLKLKTANFEVLTRSKTLSSYTDSLTLISDKAIELLRNELEHELELPALRLMGVRVADLKSKNSDVPLLQFFSKKSTHDIVEERSENEDEDEQEEEENQRLPIDENSNSSTDDNQTNACPLCHKLLLGDNEKINQHIDLCLNGEVVRTTIREEDQRSTTSTSTQKKR